MSIKNVLGYVMVMFGLVVTGVGLHASSDAPDTPTHEQKSTAASALGTVGALGAGAALCYGGYRLLSGPRAPSANVRDDETQQT